MKTHNSNKDPKVSSASPRRQFTPQDSMSQVIQYNPSEMSNRSPSPHRPQDQPKDSFYLLQQDVQQVSKIMPKVNSTKHQFNINNQIMQMNDKQRKQINLTSNVFEQACLQDILNKSPEKNPQINSSVEWTNIHYGKTKTQVNEKADFNKDYAKQKKQENLQQQYIEGSKHKSPTKTVENEMNIDIKKQNQQFSDVFGQELGDKSRNWLRPQRSLSPQMKWTTFDSIRNVKDFGDMSIKESKLRSANATKEDYKKSHPVTQPFFDCQISYEKIQGQYKQKYTQNPEVQNTKFGQEKKIESSGNKKYHGIYSWKNNYQK